VLCAEDDLVHSSWCIFFLVYIRRDNEKRRKGKLGRRLLAWDVVPLSPSVLVGIRLLEKNITKFERSFEAMSW
jgi:hypothetical protein